MEREALYEAREGGNVGDFSEKGLNEEGRLTAMMDFKTHVKSTEYIDYDHYGRGDTRIFSDITTMNGEGTEKKSGGTDNGTGKSGKGKFVAVRLVGKKVQGFARKLSSAINCFGKRGLKGEKGDAVVAESPISFETESTHVEIEAKSQDGPHVATAEVSTHHGVLENAEDEKAEAAIDVNNRDDTEEDTYEPLSACGKYETPYRVKSKAGSVESTMVIEKGIVINTLAKLRSSGSFPFKESRSLTNESEKDNNGSHPKTSHYQVSGNPVVEIDEPSLSCKEEIPGADCSAHPGDESRLPFIDSAVDRAERREVERNPIIDTVWEEAPSNHTNVGNVKKLTTLYEEDISDAYREVVVRIVSIEANSQAAPPIFALSNDDTRGGLSHDSGVFDSEKRNDEVSDSDLEYARERDEIINQEGTDEDKEILDLDSNLLRDDNDTAHQHDDDQHVHENGTELKSVPSRHDHESIVEFVESAGVARANSERSSRICAVEESSTSSFATAEETW